MNIRRLVTHGHDRGPQVSIDGGDILGLPDEAPISVASVWGLERPVIEAADHQPPPTYFPPPGGFRAVVIEWKPGSLVTEEGRRQYQQAREEVMVGYTRDARSMDGAPGTHATDTVDVGVVLSGELTMLIGDEEHCLRAGDFIVQNGTPHAWANRAEVPCRAVFFMYGTQSSDKHDVKE